MKRYFIFFLLLMVLLQNVTAYFPEQHTFLALKSLRETDSPVTRVCSTREAQIMAGSLGTDAAVVHYLENDVPVTYIGMHNRASYNRCIQLAGGDPDLKCFCYGTAMHIIQDTTSHTKMVPDIIERYWMGNKLVHALSEYRSNSLILDIAETDDTISREEVETLAKNSYLLFLQNDFDNKYVSILNQVTNLDMEPDLRIVGASIAGESFYSNVWNPNKYGLPSTYYIWTILMTTVGFLYALLIWILGKNKVKYVGVVFGIIIMALGITLTVSLATGTTYLMFKAAATTLSPIIQIDNFEQYVQTDLQESRYFWSNEILRYDDASGLSYTDANGNKVKGALIEADKIKLFGTTLPITRSGIVLVSLIAILFSPGILTWWASRKGKKG